MNKKIILKIFVNGLLYGSILANFYLLHKFLYYSKYEQFTIERHYHVYIRGKNLYISDVENYVSGLTSTIFILIIVSTGIIYLFNRYKKSNK